MRLPRSQSSHPGWVRNRLTAKGVFDFSPMACRLLSMALATAPHKSSSPVALGSSIWGVFFNRRLPCSRSHASKGVLRQTMPRQIASHQPLEPGSRVSVVLHEIVTTKKLLKRLQRASLTAMHQKQEGIGTVRVAVDGLQTAPVETNGGPMRFQLVIQGRRPVTPQGRPKTVHHQARLTPSSSSSSGPGVQRAIQ